MRTSLRKQLFTVLIFAKVSTRRFFRDPVALFFTIAFPLIFLFIFGSLNSGGGSASFNVAIINQSDSQFATEFVQQSKDSKILKLNSEAKSLDQAKEKMSRSELDATIVL